MCPYPGTERQLEEQEWKRQKGFSRGAPPAAKVATVVAVTLLLLLVVAIVIVTATVECFVKNIHTKAQQEGAGGSPTKGKLKRDLCISPKGLREGRRT